MLVGAQGRQIVGAPFVAEGVAHVPKPLHQQGLEALACRVVVRYALLNHRAMLCEEVAGVGVEGVLDAKLLQQHPVDVLPGADVALVECEPSALAPYDEDFPRAGPLERERVVGGHDEAHARKQAPYVVDDAQLPHRVQVQVDLV